MGGVLAVTTGPTSLQNLEYDYDLVGNVDWIKDWKAGSPQQQDFGYDSLNRLVTAQASGGSGGTYVLENYIYDATSGLLTSKAGVSYTYGAVAACGGMDRSLPHAVSQAGTTSYSYDCNGNQVVKDPSGSDSYNRTYDAENRITGVSGSAAASFVYDGDGNRVKGTVGTTTTYIGNYFEWAGSTSSMKKYYYAGGVRVAMRTGTYMGTTNLNYLLGDHLGSTAITADGNGYKVAELRYYP